MSTPAEISDALRRVLAHPSRGVTGLVDDLLGVCREHGLQLDWQGDRCRTRSFRGDWGEWMEVALRKSVFRAILARLASLCNERNPHSVSPYGGRGELSVGVNPPSLVKVSFANTPTEQKLELTTEGAEKEAETVSEAFSKIKKT